MADKKRHEKGDDMSEQERPEGFETEDVEGHVFETGESQVEAEGDVEGHMFETGESQIEAE